ncbi:MAG: hypothetical protein AB7H66_08095 [Hyphomonadaceae bacterium]
MRRCLAALAALAALTATPASASPAEVDRAIPGARMVGEATYRLLSVPLFRAELWNENGAFSWERPFALSLTYERSARASTLINRSIREMGSRGAGNAQALAPLRAQFERCFTSVARGDRFTGVSTGSDTARFYLNGAHRCDVRWPSFRRHFFGIWLAGRDGPAAEISAQLRGEG